MNERERIQALLEAGKISQDEANILLSALDESDQASQEAGPIFDAANQQFRAEPTLSSAVDPSLNWVRVELTAGNLEVRVDPSLSEPVASGGLSLEKDGQNYRAGSGDDGGIFSFFKSGSFSESSLALPAGYGLEVNTRAGNVTVHSVPYLKGKVTAGQLIAYGVGGVDVEVRAGNFEGSAALTSGQHRINVSAGNAELRLEPQSDYRLRGQVVMGNLETTGRYQNHGGGLHQSVNVLHGQGKADLRVDVKMGNCWIET